jgi:hypothetical protein
LSNLVVTTIAGNGIGDNFNGASTISSINYPIGVAVDLQGNVYVSEYNRIKKITPAGALSVLAGNGVRGFADTIGAYAEFSPTTGIAVDGQGYVYVADRDNQRIRKITPAGLVSTFAGSSTYGYVDGKGANAKFWTPNAVAVDLNGNVFVSDYSNKRIRKIAPDGTVSTLAGDGNTGFVDGPGTQAEFDDIESLAVDQQGNVYVCEQWDGRIRKITPSGMVSTLAANSQSVLEVFKEPLGVAVDANGNIYVANQADGVISILNVSGKASNYAGNGTQGYLDGPTATAEFNLPNSLAVDAQGNVYVSDLGNFRIRKITNQ